METKKQRNSYDPEVIQRFADRLYARSAGVILVSTLLGGIIGFVVDPFIQQALPGNLSVNVPQWVSGLVFAVLGFLQGTERAFLLKLQAQTALCQMQIEQNTHKASDEP
ncbi:MAG TPA: hypothetical protein VMF06_17820 [Candidatus Limnocylindria bacterium]|jgi:hypothetical protein|nr:hypothetical protein [Candidatus Limnocylindria bacterium]